ncbi:MAG TPA: elongation factor G [Phycisphaerae bacterium]|nr:elongation factor G [Phycisphaerae bacterium]HNU44451.1 elongation factor G [Phycisphaerae bacterium]
MSVDLRTVRNIGIAAHIDAGKTTTTERVLYYTGCTHRMGDVDDGTTVTDYDEQEQQRGITIYSVAVSCPWKGHTINLIDTPGHVDFTAEVERSLRVLDGMVAVFDAREGVEAQSETVWRQADKYHVPRLCFINKMDRLGADFERAVASLREKLHARPLVIELPIGAGDTFTGVIDLIEMRALYFKTAELGGTLEAGPIPEELLQRAGELRAQLCEALAERCEVLMEKYVNEERIPPADIRRALRELTVSGAGQPVLCGSALRYVGIQPMLDAVCDYLPSPLDMPPVEGTDPQRPETTRQLRCDPAGPLAALVFKVLPEKPVDLFFVRVYSGTLKPSSRVLNSASGGKENVTRVYRMFAKRREQLDKAEAGDIVAIVGPKNVLTGHTLCDPRHPVVLESIQFPETVISVSIEPRSSRDRDKLLEALHALERQDPTIRMTVNAETGQTLLAGMGELHLEVVVHRLKCDMNVEVHVGRPQVSYRETVRGVGLGEGRFARQTGGRAHFAAVRLRVEPRAHVPGRPNFEIVRDLPPDSLLPLYLAAIEAGVADAAQSGPLGGYPVIDWRVTVLGGEQHQTDSSELAFESAGRIAFYDAMQKAGPVLLQPIMSVEVTTPDEYLGAIIGDLNGRGAEVRETELRGSERVIRAEVPLAELFGYVTKLRSVSQGRAAASVTPLHYSAVPADVARALVGGV